MTGDAGTTDATEHRQQAKVLTVSDGVMAGVRKDSSGAGLVSHLEAAGFEVIEHRTISDGVDNVSNTLSYMALNFVGLIATTGGTGFGPRDDTPEGTRRILDKPAPGLTTAMATARCGRRSGSIVDPQPARLARRRGRDPRVGPRRRPPRARAPRREAGSAPDPRSVGPRSTSSPPPGIGS